MFMSISLAICRWCDICIFTVRNKDVVVVVVVVVGRVCLYLDSPVKGFSTLVAMCLFHINIYSAVLSCF